MINIPLGHYREDQLANLSLHRFAVDGSVAVSWHDPASGWDISAKGGYTLNGDNDYTGYDSGDEVHVEAAVEKALSPKFSLGAQAYDRSEEHTSELQSLMRISYSVSCLKKKIHPTDHITNKDL